MIESRQQVHRIIAVPGGAHRLAVHRQHPATTPAAGAGGRGRLTCHDLKLTQTGADPGADRGLQSAGVHRDQDPPDRGGSGSRPGQSHLTALGIGQVGHPLSDRGEGTRAGQHRAYGDAEQRHERIPHPTPAPWIWHHRQSVRQPAPVTIGGQQQSAGLARQRPGELIQHATDGGKWHRQARLPGRS